MFAKEFIDGRALLEERGFFGEGWLCGRRPGWEAGERGLRFFVVVNVCGCSSLVLLFEVEVGHFIPFRVFNDFEAFCERSRLLLC